MEEREIITIGFGNYATLVAAQWANSTSHFDVHHNTLYRERSITHVVGGSGHVGDDDDDGGGGACGGAMGSRRTARVPRLLLLDAPHATDLQEMPDVEAEMDQWDSKRARKARERSARKDEDGDGGRDRSQMENVLFVDPASSMLWQKPNAPHERPPTTQELRLQKAAHFASRRWARKYHRSHRRPQPCGSSDEDEGNNLCEEDDSDDEAEDGDEDDYYFQLQHPHNGIEVANAFGPCSSMTDPEGEGHDHDGSGGGGDGDDADAVSHRSGAQTEQKPSKAFYKRKLFRRQDATVPWWRYITTGLDVDSITAMRPPQHVDAGGEIPSLHNVGYGLSAFKSGNGVSGAGAEAEALANALRKQLEDADGVQGLQCFIDGDSMFGGAAYNTLTEFWEDVGPKLPATAFTVFSPLPAAFTDVETAKSIPFAERRRDEVVLNRLLCTSLLSQPTSALYIPIEVADWPTLFSSSCSCWWRDDDTATAQYIAAVADSSLYGLRDSGSGSEAGRPAGPAFYMAEWARTLRPTPSMRLTALLGSLPLPVPDVVDGQASGKRKGGRSTDLWTFLERTPLLPGTATDGKGNQEEARAPRRGDFVPLTHAFSLSPQAEAGRVVGHAVSLRGAGVLESAIYPPQEAMLRYALPLRTGTYLPLLTRTSIPISHTFPLSLLFDSPDAMSAVERQCEAVGLPARGAFAERGLSVGAHAVTSYQSAPMLHTIVSNAKAALRFKEQLFSTSYGLEKDEWVERVEDVAEMYDDYRHEDCGANDESSGDDGW